MTEPAATVVLVTAPTQELAEQITTMIVQERLAACGNIVPGITSIYRWQDEVQHDTEVLIVFKTVNETVQRLAERVKELHPYEVPEVIALPVTAGSAAYLKWVAANATG